MSEKDIKRTIGGIIAAVLLFGLLSYMGIESGFLKVVILGLLLVALFSDKFGAAAPGLRWVLSVVAVGLILFAWPVTSPTANWGQHRVEQKAPKDNFDPKSTPADPQNPTVDAAVKFVRLEDGTLDSVPLSWKRDPRTGLALAEPGTAEYWAELNEFNAQSAKRKGAASTALPRQWEETFALEPGEVEVIDPESLTCGGEFVHRNVEILVEEGCVEVTIDGTPYTECVDDNTPAPDGEYFVVRNRTETVARFMARVTSTRRC